MMISYDIENKKRKEPRGKNKQEAKSMRLQKGAIIVYYLVYYLNLKVNDKNIVNINRAH